MVITPPLPPDPPTTHMYTLFSASKSRMQMSENKVTLESYLNLIRFFKCFRKETFNFGYLFLIKKNTQVILPKNDRTGILPGNLC